jgi:hypothetical protein
MTHQERMDRKYFNPGKYLTAAEKLDKKNGIAVLLAEKQAVLENAGWKTSEKQNVKMFRVIRFLQFCIDQDIREVTAEVTAFVALLEK